MGKEMNADWLTSVKEAEDKLAGQERKGDLDDLPTGHPLRLALMEAEEREKRRQELEAELGEDKVKRGKKIKTKKKAKEDNRKARELEELNKKVVDAAKGINKKTEEIAASLVDLSKMIAGANALCTEHPSLRARLLRSERMVLAFRKGLMDARIKPKPIQFSDR